MMPLRREMTNPPSGSFFRPTPSIYSHKHLPSSVRLIDFFASIYVPKHTLDFVRKVAEKDPTMSTQQLFELLNDRAASCMGIYFLAPKKDKKTLPKSITSPYISFKEKEKTYMRGLCKRFPSRFSFIGRYESAMIELCAPQMASEDQVAFTICFDNQKHIFCTISNLEEKREVATTTAQHRKRTRRRAEKGGRKGKEKEREKEKEKETDGEAETGARAKQKRRDKKSQEPWYYVVDHVYWFRDQNDNECLLIELLCSASAKELPAKLVRKVTAGIKVRISFGDKQHLIFKWKLAKNTRRRRYGLPEYQKLSELKTFYDLKGLVLQVSYTVVLISLRDCLLSKCLARLQTFPDESGLVTEMQPKSVEKVNDGRLVTLLVRE